MTPTDLTISPRDRRFARGRRAARHWLNGDPIATAFFNALSITCPRGEAYFIDSVRAFRDGVPEKLAGEIAAFIKQEVVHSREHLAFNRQVTDHGYDVSRLDADVTMVLDLAKQRPPIASLAATMALEHFTRAIWTAPIRKSPRSGAGTRSRRSSIRVWPMTHGSTPPAIGPDSSAGG
jgi:predicted metal-dependent hydrolase